MRQISVFILAGVALWVCLAVLCHPALAETPKTLLDEPDLLITLQTAEMTEEGVRAVFSCLNRTERKEPLLFLIPKGDGVDTVFGNGWPSEEIQLPPGAEEETELLFLFPEGQDTAASFSIRFSFRKQLSSEAVFCPGETPDCVPGSYSLPETQIVQETVRAKTDKRPAPILLQDQITQEQAALLDYGQAWVCLQQGDLLLPFCRILLKVDASGHAEGWYSGLAVAFDGEPVQPLEVQETSGDGPTVAESKEISLTGESVFYATLKLTLEEDAENGFRVTRQELFSSELGGTYDQAPLGVADTAEALLRVLEKSEAPVEVTDTRSQFLSLAEPLALTIFPACEMGEILVYCEYFFMDGTDIVHPPFPLPQ